MAQIIVENGPDEGTRFTLSRDAACTIGADDACEVRLRSPGVAARHMVVKALRGEGFGAKGLDGPITIGGQSIAAARLRDGEVIEIGNVRLRFDASDDAPAESSDKVLGGFRLFEELGRGGMGIVYRAEQISLHREVALKVLSQELTQDPVFVARFVAEARAAARLHHPNVVQVFDVGHEGETYYYSMEVMHEGSLERRLKQTGRLEVDEAIDLIADAARGLSFAESLNIVHRDIKPDNLMIDHHGTVKIVDLGLALSDEDTGNKIVGTPHFMSPEQALRKPLDHRSDLYSLGCTFYRLVTGRTPFRGSTSVDILRAQIKEPVESPREVNDEIPAEVSDVIERLLEKSPDDRYQSASELLEDLEALRAPPSRKGLLFGSIAAAVVVAGGALWWGLTRENTTTVTTKIITQDNPDAERLREETRLAAARAAFFEVKSRDLDGIPLAEALEGMAAAHPDTEWATKATSEAATARAAVAAAEAARVAYAERVAALVGKLRKDVEGAIASGSYRDAERALQTSQIPDDLRGDAKIMETVTALTTDVRRSADARLAELTGAIDAAKEARDPDALDEAVEALAPLLDTQTGWPAMALPQPEKITQLVATARADVDALRRDAAQAARARAWAKYAKACLEGDGVVAAIDRFAFAQAAERATQLAAEQPDGEIRTRLEHLGEASRAAARFLERFTAAAATGDLPYRGPDPQGEDLIAGFALSGEAAGLTVKYGPRIRPKTRTVPLTTLRQDGLAEVFDLPDADPTDRGAFLALLEIARHLRAADDYVGHVDRSDDSSGTGSEAYPANAEVLSLAVNLLTQSSDSWSATLRHETESTEMLVRGLRAFSSERYGTAAGLLERLAREAPHSLAVVHLR